METLTATVEVTNTGPVAGEEVVQLYIGYEDSQVERPVKELKGFDRVELQLGETKQVVLYIPAHRLAYYGESKSDWVVEAITYHVYVGASSAAGDLLHGQFQVKQ